MKTKILLLTTLMLLASIPCRAITITYSDGNDIITVQELPHTYDFTIDGIHVDLGILHKQFSILGIPIWNYGDEKYVLFHENEKSYTYYDLDFEEICTLHELFDVPITPTIPFWDKLGGKILVIIIIIMFILVATDNLG